MARIYIPAGNELHRALRGFGAPGKKPVQAVRWKGPPGSYFWLYDNTEKAISIVDGMSESMRNNRVGANITKSADYLLLPGATDPADSDVHDLPPAMAPGTGDFTFFLDIYVENQKLNVAAIAGRGVGSNSESGWGLRQIGSSNELQLLVGNGTSRVATSTTGFSLAKWAQLVCVADRSGDLKLFFDGKLNTSASLTSLSGSYTPSLTPTVGYLTALENNYQATFRIKSFGWLSKALSDAEAAEASKDLYVFFTEPANQSPFIIGTAAAGGPDYSETLSSSVTSSANLVETYQAPAYNEVLSSSVTSSANLVETYQAPSYSEVLASSVTSSANLVETYGAPSYSEVLASAVTSSASLVEAYEFGQNYQETITASVTSSATFAEAYQAPAYNETISVSVTSSANLVETWEVAYTEVIASAVTSSATFAETYESGLSYAETISASVTSSANLVETYGAPSYSELMASAVTSSATFTEAFTTPQALPTIVELSAITLPGYSAKSLRID